MLHVIFQRHGIPPHEIYALEPRHRAFMYASMELTLEMEEAERKKLKGGAR